MYLAPLKACIVEALQSVFNSSFPDPNFQNLKVSIEYPLDAQSYPSIWVNYDDNDSLQIVGIQHREYITNPDSSLSEATRWSFAGEVSLTAVALSSLERDNLYDELVRIFAFSRVENAAKDFRTVLESNDFIALNVNWDQLRPHGDAAAPGTPWGTEDEVIYEKSLAFDVEGEFVSDPATNTLLRLSHVVVTGTNATTPVDLLEENPYMLGVPN
jgi:hypothetical protein